MAAPHLSPYVIHGDLVYLSGQLAFDAQGAITGDIAAQTRRCLDNITATLGELGLGPGAVIKTTVWITAPEHFAAFNQAYADFFGDHRPARSTTIAGLALPAALIEIEAIAAR
ncbi:MAG: enamine deaminase RidA [Sphingomonas bacterium]|nr:enamine deaminase RidA [Sphingomonas bacterium]